MDDSRHTEIQSDDDTLLWDRLSEVVEAFSDAWEKSEAAPELKDFVDEADDPHLKRLVLTELIKVDLELRRENDQPIKQLDEYFEEWPQLLLDGSPPLDLVYEEYQVRQRLGESVTADEYLNTYANCKTALGRLLGESAEVSTSVFASLQKKEYETGDQVDDFQIISKLGQGAFATVYLARQVSMQRLVALKVSADKGVEHQMLAQLDHPHIVRVYDVRKDRETGDRLMYMQYVSGGTLQEIARYVHQSDERNGKRFLAGIDQRLIDKGESPPQDSENRSEVAKLNWPRTVCRLGSQLADALAFAHKQNVLHRDLKPANVLIAANGSPKLVDFNISHCSKIEGVSPAAYFGGSLAYMSPEQLEAFSPGSERTPDTLDAKADIYSLGCMLYELLTGHKPFEVIPNTGDWQRMLTAMIEQRKKGLSEPARARMQSAPRLLVSAIERCLEPNPENRFESAHPLSRQLEWGTDPEIESATLPDDGPIGRVFRRFPALVVMAIAAAISGLAAVFISSYNVEESVPAESLGFFKLTRNVMNGVAFPAAMFFYLWATQTVSRNVRRTLNREKIPKGEVKTAIERNLIVGHWGAIACAILWITAGFLYPIILSMDVSMDSRGWIDFIFSHLLAGLITSAYSFFAATYCAMRYWQPVLFRNFLRLREIPDVQPAIDRLKTIVSVYQFVVVMIPMLSVALLVLWGGAEKKYPLIVVSVVSVIGVGFVFWAARQILDRIAITKKMSTSSLN